MLRSRDNPPSRKKYVSTDAGSAAKTCAATYTWHSLDVTLAADDVGDAVEIQAYKDSATANSISIDMIVCVSI